MCSGHTCCPAPKSTSPTKTATATGRRRPLSDPSLVVHGGEGCAQSLYARDTHAHATTTTIAAVAAAAAATAIAATKALLGVTAEKSTYAASPAVSVLLGATPPAAPAPRNDEHPPFTAAVWPRMVPDAPIAQAASVLADLFASLTAALSAAMSATPKLATLPAVAPMFDAYREDTANKYHKIGGHSFPKLIGSDPGVTNVHNFVILELDGLSKDVVLTREEYLHGCGDYAANAECKAFEDKSGIKAINDKMPSHEMPTSKDLAAYIRYRRANADALRDYNLDPAHAQIKQRNEQRRKQFQAEFVRDLAPECRTPCERAGVIAVRACGRDRRASVRA